MREKIKEPSNVTKVQLHGMLVLRNVRMVPSNVRKKKKRGTIECDKSIVTCDVGTAQCEDGIIKCEKKNKGTTDCDKSTVTCDFSTTQCEDGTIKCDVLVTWYSRLPTNGYRTPPPKKKGVL